MEPPLSCRSRPAVVLLVLQPLALRCLWSATPAAAPKWYARVRLTPRRRLRQRRLRRQN